MMQHPAVTHTQAGEGTNQRVIWTTHTTASSKVTAEEDKEESSLRSVIEPLPAEPPSPLTSNKGSTATAATFTQGMARLTASPDTAARQAEAGVVSAVDIVVTGG